MYRRRKVIPDTKPPFPTSIDGFGYVIKDNGEIRSKDEGNYFLFKRDFFSFSLNLFHR